MSPQDELTPAEREFELALKSLTPTPARVDPAAAAFEAGRRQARRRRWGWQAAAAAVAGMAAVSAWLTLASLRSKPERVQRPERNDSRGLVAMVEPPTLLVYSRALTKSPAALYALLDQQATTLNGIRENEELGPIGAPTLWNVNFHASLGDL